MFTVFVPFHPYARLKVAPVTVARLSVTLAHYRPMKYNLTLNRRRSPIKVV